MNGNRDAGEVWKTIKIPNFSISGIEKYHIKEQNMSPIKSCSKNACT